MSSISDLPRTLSFIDFCERVALCLASCALVEKYPLNVIFDSAAMRYSHRQQAAFRKICAKTWLFYEFFY